MECTSHVWRVVSYSNPAEAEEGYCDQPKKFACQLCGEVVRCRCGVSSSKRCEPCGKTYRRRVGRIIRNGCLSRPGDLLFLTLTAPGEKAHTDKFGRQCPCTPDEGVEVGEWNQGLPKRWNRFVEDVRRKLGIELEYLKSTEVQKRGALHLHVMARVVRPSPIRKASIRRLAIAHGFGHELELRELTGRGSVAAHARYCAKYVSKTVDERYSVPWGDEVGNPRMRAWTASRDWGVRMLDVKAEERGWWSERQGTTAESTERAPAAEGSEHAERVQLGTG